MNDSSRYLGCMLGLAVGDALGFPVEFNSRGPFNVADLKSPLYSDDTQMSIATVEGILAGDGVSGVYRAYLRWLRTQSDRSQRRAPGGTCLSALASHTMGTIEGPLNHSKGCGGVMRVAPVGLAYKPRTAFRIAAECAAITHGHPSGYLSAGFFAELVSCLVEGSGLEESLDAATETLRTFEHYEETLEAVQGGRRLAADPDQTRSDIESLGGGWVGEEALAIAVYCSLRFADDYREGVLAAVNHGGDSDSTGCICGAILGTLLGVEAIPRRWAESVENAALLRKLADELSQRLRIEEPEKEGFYPMKLKCPICGKALSVSTAGKHRCPSCRTTFEFDKKGKVALL